MLHDGLNQSCQTTGLFTLQLRQSFLAISDFGTRLFLLVAESQSQDHLEASCRNNTLLGRCHHLIAGGSHCRLGAYGDQPHGHHGLARPQSGRQPWTENGETCVEAVGVQWNTNMQAVLCLAPLTYWSTHASTQQTWRMFTDQNMRTSA